MGPRFCGGDNESGGDDEGGNDSESRRKITTTIESLRGHAQRRFP